MNSFNFNLQRFAAKAFTGGEIGEETGVVLSDLFDSNGNAAITPGSKASVYEGDNSVFWDRASTVVNLTPAAANTEYSAAGAIILVSGKYDTLGGLGGNDQTGYVISALTAIDASGIGSDATLKFNNIANTAILNPAGTIAIANNTLTFSGTGSQDEDSSLNWYVGTQISVKSGAIVNVTATDGEEITTADGTYVYFTGKNTATFSNKSFNTITTFSEDNAAALNVSDTLDGANTFLNVEEYANNVADGKAAITTTFNGQAIKSVTFGGTKSSVVADVSYGGNANVGTDVSIQGSAINVSNIDGESSTIIYSIGTDNGNILNVFDVATKANKTLTVSKTGGANYLIAQDDSATAATAVNVGGVAYAFNDADDTSGNGGLFEITSGKVTGFVFRDEGDAITIPKDTSLSNFNLYTAEAGYDEGNSSFMPPEKLPFTLNVTGSESDYIVSQGHGGTFDIEVFNGAQVAITTNINGKKSTVNMGVTLNTLTANRRSPASVVITVDEDGVLQSITDGSATGTTGENTGMQVSGSTITIKGLNENNTSADFYIGVGENTIAAGVASGQFDYVREGNTNSTSGVNAIQLTASRDTLTAVSENTKIYPYAGTAGTLVYGTDKYEYSFNNASGKVFFTLDESDGSLDFVFVEAGDAITIPEDAAFVTGLQFINKADENYDPYAMTGTSVVTIPTVNFSGNYTVTMTTATNTRSAAAEFAISGIGAEATVNFSDATFTYGAAGGTFLFAQDGTESTTADGFTAASGTVAMNAAAASLLSTADDKGNARFKIDGTAVRIDAEISEKEYALIFNHDDNSLFGLTGGTTIYDAGSVKKIYAPTEADAVFTFAGNNQVFAVRGFEGTAENPANRAYFTVDGTKATGFTFVSTDDQITSAGGFSSITLVDAPTGNTFTAPAITDADGNVESGTIIKTIANYDGTEYKNCFALIDENLEGRKVTFEDDTAATFNNVNDSTEILFSTAGKMLAIQGLYEDYNEVAFENAQNAVFIDGNEIEIIGGFTYRMITSNEATITDLKAGSVVRKAGVEQIRTIAGDLGNGIFTFGDVSYKVSGNVDGVTFNLDGNGSVTSIDDINGTESVKKVVSESAIVRYDNTADAKVTMTSAFEVGDASSRTEAIYLVGNALDNSLIGGSGKDSLFGKDGNDYLTGGDGADKLYGQNGNDTLNGGAGNDTLIGGEGDDVFVYSAGNDVITDYEEGDKISLGAAVSKASLDGENAVLIVGSGKLTVNNAKELTLIDADGNELSTIISNATIYDDSAADKVTMPSAAEVGDASERTEGIYLVGNALANSLIGGSGKDLLFGKDGDDYIEGGDGADKLYGQNGNDTLDGGTGNDTLTGGAGADTFIYTAGKDLITDMTATDTLQIGDGTDTYSKSTSGSNIILTVGNGNITLKGAANLSTLNILGKESAPTITYDDSAADKVTMASAFEVGDASERTEGIYLVGNALANSLIGGSGKDSLFGKDGDDYIEGGDGADKLYGQNGNDTLDGGTGNDTLMGGAGADLFIYTAGKDLITDMTATDTLQIGDGSDTYSKSTSGSNIIITVGDGLITLKGAANLSTLNIVGEESLPVETYDDSAADKVTMASAIEVGDASERTEGIYLVGNKLANSLIGGSGADLLFGKDGNDYLEGGDGADKLYGQNGNDTLDGSAGNDTLTGGAGSDLFIYTAGKDLITDMTATDTLQIGDGTDTYSKSTNGSNIIVTVGNGLITLKGAASLSTLNILGEESLPVETYDDSAADKVTMGSAIEVGDASKRTTGIYLVGNKLNNSLIGSSYKDSLFGKDGNDYLTGNAGNDKLYGQNGDDTLWGGKGNDTLIGGAGADTFIYNDGEGKDVITDFGDDDLLQITGDWTATYSSSAKTITFDVGSTASAITLKNVTTSDTLNINGDGYAISSTKLVKQ